MKRLVEFGTWFARKREESGFSSQRELADTTGLSNSTINRIEQGDVPKANTLKQLAEKMHATTYEEMMMRAGYIDDDERQEEIDHEFLEQWHRIQEKSKTAHIQGVLPRVAGRRLLKGHLDSYESMLDDIIKDNEQREKDK